MRVGVPKEAVPGERRVALGPETVGRLGAGVEVVVEPGAGSAAGFADEAYGDAGAALGDAWFADVVVKVASPTAAEVPRLREGQVLVAFLAPLADPDGIERLARAGVHALALESIPRITRAQPMDALSSQATVAGYKAALLAADTLPRFLPMLMTAAGTIPPAKVLVLGAGVAGLQAIATARRLGGVVSAFDVRPAVREQVESLGASFLDLGVRGEETEGGGARDAPGIGDRRSRRGDGRQLRAHAPRRGGERGRRARRRDDEPAVDDADARQLAPRAQHRRAAQAARPRRQPGARLGRRDRR